MKKFITAKLAESPIEITLHPRILTLATSFLSSSNLLEDKEHTLKKFTYARELDQNQPFIPNLASNFKLTASEQIIGSEFFMTLRDAVEKAQI